MNEMFGIGLMSGTSLDGTDLVYCGFYGGSKKFEQRHSYTFPYPCELKSALEKAPSLKGGALTLLHIELGKYYGQLVRNFVDTFGISRVDYVASHGHTVFHRPEKKLTLQIGHPGYIAIESGYLTIGDFRSADVFLGGQGAPLVPVGDRDLFGAYKNRINLGGFANISFENHEKTIAFDICPANMALNDLAVQTGLSFDDNGAIASSGKVDQNLLSALNDLPFYKKSPPKSLGREWYEEKFRPRVAQSGASLADKLRTVTEHIAIQIAAAMTEGDALVTGGGAHNGFLIKRFKNLSKNRIIIPDNRIVDFKEALVFAYLGYLRLQQKPNTISSVTGARVSHAGGAVYLVEKKGFA